MELHHFHGGIHLEDHKQDSTTLPVAPAALPRKLYLPLHQHIGEPAEVMVAPGDRVLKGQMVARANAYVSAPLHASSSGTVIAIEDCVVPHASGLSAACIVIETDDEDRWCELKPVNDYRAMGLSELRNRVRQAGIVGLGGAAFPTAVKFNPGPQRRVDTLIINGAECEPYISCDDMLMRERPEEIIAGIHIVMHAVGAERCLVGIEDNKPEAFVAIRVAARSSSAIQVVKIPTRYPTGGEKQLIQVLTGREVPSQGLPVDIGALCVNVGTAASVHRAINLGEPLISRYVTISGAGIRKPRNLEARIGTPVGELIEQCGGLVMDNPRLVMGGPMMGFEMPSDSVPVIKATNCVLVTAHEPEPHPQPCIRCGRCAEICPAQLLPQQLYWHAHARNFDKLKDYNLFDCIECGCCAYVCPSSLPLVHYYRYAKTEILERERDKRQADVARRRTEYRRFRLEREKQEREARHAAKKAALKSGVPSADEALTAAQQRVQEKSSAKVERLKQALARPDERPEETATLSAAERAIIKAARERAADRDTGTRDDETVGK